MSNRHEVSNFVDQDAFEANMSTNAWTRHILRTFVGCVAVTLFLSPAAPVNVQETPVPVLPAYRLALPFVSVAPNRLLIAAAYIDSSVPHEPDSAILIWNLGPRPQAMAGWQIESGRDVAAFPLTSTVKIDVAGRLWCAAEATAFADAFGEPAGCEWDADTTAAPNLIGTLSLVYSRPK
jgi:hypothetical protein